VLKPLFLVAFGAHFYKDISRGQLESAAKSFGITKKHEKSDYMIPLAKSLLNNGFIKIYKNADFTSLGRDDIKRVKLGKHTYKTYLLLVHVFLCKST